MLEYKAIRGIMGMLQEEVTLKTAVTYDSRGAICASCPSEVFGGGRAASTVSTLRPALRKQP